MEGIDLTMLEKLKTKICKQIEKAVDENDADTAYRYASLLGYLE